MLDHCPRCHSPVQPKHSRCTECGSSLPRRHDFFFISLLLLALVGLVAVIGSIFWKYTG
ncbi:MAG: hypothetical protein ACLFTB_04395 [Desulfovibrionales bacterium]